MLCSLRSQVSCDTTTTMTPQAVITPVRRSTRISSSQLPPMLHDHNTVLDNLQDLPHDLHVLFQKNLALDFSSDSSSDEEEGEGEVSVFEGSYLLEGVNV